jgi:hypothetical protein
MAFKKAKQLNTGITIDYWRIVQINTNCDRQDCVITICGYLNKEARDNGANPVDSIQWDLGLDFFLAEVEKGQAGDKLRTTLYNLLKQTANGQSDEPRDIDIFRDAIDC